MINAGKYNKQIRIYKTVQGKDADGFPQNTEEHGRTRFKSVGRGQEHKRLYLNRERVGL